MSKTLKWYCSSKKKNKELAKKKDGKCLFILIRKGKILF